MLVLFWRAPAVALQVAAPVADIAAGGWTNEAGSSANLYASLDESFRDDNDYIQSSLSPAVVEEVRLRLAPLVDPGVDDSHVLYYRYAKSAPIGDRIDLTVRLYAADATTLIAEQVHPDIGSVTDAALVLSEAEAAAIPSNDYVSGLVLGFRAVKI